MEANFLVLAAKELPGPRFLERAQVSSAEVDSDFSDESCACCATKTTSQPAMSHCITDLLHVERRSAGSSAPQLYSRSSTFRSECFALCVKVSG
jgi:hypothetical protein